MKYKKKICISANEFPEARESEKSIIALIFVTLNNIL